jgi:hypothetical protein
MKIILNKDESYEIEIPKVVDIGGFHKILNKFEGIIKIVKINELAGTNFKDFKKDFNKRSYNKAKGNIYLNTKAKCIDIMQYYYHGTEADRIRISKIVGRDTETIIKDFSRFRKKFGITPQEVGLISFKNFKKGTPLIKMLDYTIKSYTGIFDEAEEPKAQDFLKTTAIRNK